MPQQVQVDGVGLVEFSDDFTPDEIASQVDNIFARQEMEEAKPDIFERFDQAAPELLERVITGLPEALINIPNIPALAGQVIAPKIFPPGMEMPVEWGKVPFTLRSEQELIPQPGEVETVADALGVIGQGLLGGRGSAYQQVGEAIAGRQMPIRPPISVEEEKVRRIEVASELVGAGYAAYDLMRFFATPEGFATIFSARYQLARSLSAAGFATDMAAKVQEAAQKAGEMEANAVTPEEKAQAKRAKFSLIANVIFPGLIAGGAVKAGEIRPPKIGPIAMPETEAGMRREIDYPKAIAEVRLQAEDAGAIAEAQETLGRQIAEAKKPLTENQLRIVAESLAQAMGARLTRQKLKQAGVPNAIQRQTEGPIPGLSPQPPVNEGPVPRPEVPTPIPEGGGGQARPPGGPPGAPRPQPPGGPVTPAAKGLLKPAPEGAFEEVEGIKDKSGKTVIRWFQIKRGTYKSTDEGTYGPGGGVSDAQMQMLGFEVPPPPRPGTQLRTAEQVKAEVKAGLKEVTPDVKKEVQGQVPVQEVTEPTAGTAPAAPAPVSPTPSPAVPVPTTAKPAGALAEAKPVAAAPVLPEGGIGSVGAAAPAEFAERRAFKPEKGPLPDFQEPATAKATFAQPWGFERIPVLGAVMGGVRPLQGYVNESLATFFGERQAGRAISSALGAEYSWIDKPWQIKDGQIQNITPRDPNASRYIADVIEALQRDPNAFELTPEQRTAFDAIQSLESSFDRLEQKYQVGKRADNEGVEPDQIQLWEDLPKEEGPYFPRVVTSRPGGRTYGLTKGARVGAKAFFEKPRMFDTEAEGWQKGYRYEESVSKRVATRAERLYKRIADKRLATDPSLGGIERAELVAQLKESYSEELMSGKWTEKRIEQMADSIEQRGKVYQPAFFKIIFPEETARALNKAFPNTQSVIRQGAASVNNALKGLWLGFDWGVGMIQGQLTGLRYPMIWAQANYRSIRGMFSRDYFPEYVRRNLEPVRELAQLGSSVGRLEEYMAGFSQKEWLTRFPEEIGKRLERVPGIKGVGKGIEALAEVPRAFGRQFQTFLDVAKVEIWKSLREVTPRDQWSSTVQSIESILESSSMERVGLSPGRTLIERVFLLAPAYYRGALNVVAATAERGMSGAIVRRALGSYAFGGTLIFYAVAKALGMSDDDILRRFNPTRSDFMMWQVKVGGKNVSIGPGGILRSLIRLGGNIVKTSVEHPENWKSLSPDKNPITRFYRGHAGPLPGLVWDQFSGRDYLGQDADITGLRRVFYPLSIRAFQQEPGRPKPSGLEPPATFAGLNVFTEPGRQSEAEVRKAVRTWMRFNPRPEIRARVALPSGTFPQSQYNPLRFALDENDLVSAKREFQKLLAAKGNTVEARRRIEQEFNYRTASGNLKPFSDSLKMEPAFRASLSPKQKILYTEAIKERRELYQRFRKMLVLPTAQP